MTTYTLDNLPIDKDRYKIIALDLDDTLLNSRKEISAVNIEAVQKAHRQGYRIVITTGRHPKSAQRYLSLLNCLDDNSYSVCYNGSAVIRLSDFIAAHHNINFPVLHHAFLSGQMANELCTFAHEQHCFFHGYSKDRGLVVENHNPYSQVEIDHSGVEFLEVDLTSCQPSESFFKVIIVGEKEDIDRVTLAVPQKFCDFCSVLRTSPNFLEFIPEHSTKATALEMLCQKLGLSMQNVMAFGDAQNDYDMLKNAGLGIAMSNGYDSVKEAADVVTLSNDEDGVAYIINRFLR